jgi:teichuronic acid biosynthesis glycosyltransferase TuaG
VFVEGELSEVLVPVGGEKPFVSVIMPAYNCEKHIAEAIASIQYQTLTDWELCVTDDCSTDGTAEIIRIMAEDDPRIRYARQLENAGAAEARNEALGRTRGRFVTYLDADDIWYPAKLERQVAFMQERGCGFSCASYEVIDEDNRPMGRTVTMPAESDWWGYLTNNYLQTVGIMADLEKVDRSLLHMPDMRRRQDAAAWLQVLKAGHVCYGVPEVLCAYRRVAGSLSSNKVKAVKDTWYFYTQVAKLPLPQACYCFCRYAALAVWKRTYMEKPSSHPNVAQKESMSQ